MAPWLESFGVLLLAAGGVLAGAWFSRLRKPYWLLGYLLPMSVIGVFAIGVRYPAITFYAPVSWLVTGRIKFALIGVVAPMVLTTPLMKLPKHRDRIAVSAFMTVVVLGMSVWPFLAPAFNRSYLAGLTTKVDGNGICLQTTPYTCGPAAAVTALRKLGFPAEEGEIAILAHTSAAIGTPTDLLAQTLRAKYGKDGLVCDYRVFKNLTELREAGLTLAV